MPLFSGPAHSHEVTRFVNGLIEGWNPSRVTNLSMPCFQRELECRAEPNIAGIAAMSGTLSLSASPRLNRNARLEGLGL
jgi:hypothetical protein